MHIFYIFFLSIDKVLKPDLLYFGSRKIALEEKLPPALILTLTLNQTLTLTGGQFSRHPSRLIILNNLYFKFQLRDMIIAFLVK